MNPLIQSNTDTQIILPLVDAGLLKNAVLVFVKILRANYWLLNLNNG